MRILLIAILIYLNFIQAFDVFAEDIKRGEKGTIGKQDILEIFKKGEVVNGYVIKGNDLIEIIRDTDLAIRVKNSVIEGGLDFEKLPLGPVKKRRTANRME